MSLNSEHLKLILKYFSIIHHVPGRIRFRVSSDIMNCSDIKINNIDKEIEKINGIKKIKVNKLIGSVTIEYDKHILSEEFWEKLLKGEDIGDLDDEIGNIVRKFS